MRSAFGRHFASSRSGKTTAAGFTAITATTPFLVNGFAGATQHPRSRRYASSTVATAAESTIKAVPNKARSSESSSLMKWYEGHLEASPVRTKMATGGLLWGVGDAVAQIVPGLLAGEEEPPESKKRKGSKKSTPIVPYDFARTARAVFFGFSIHAPSSHVHFNFLEWMTVKGGFTGMAIPVFKTVMEQFVYWSWVSNSMYHGAMGAMQGHNLNQIYDRIEDVLWETQKAQWVFWIPIQLLNFKFVPVRHQLNVVLLTSIAWTALLSGWYPPENGEEGEDLSGFVEEATEDATKVVEQKT
jgi:protein Mpv17